MRALLGKVRTKVGVAVIGAALVAVGGTATAAAVTASPDPGEVAEVTPVTGEPAPATTAAVATAAPADVAPPVEDTAAATVDAVTQPEPAAVPEQTETPTPAGPDLSTTWTDEAGNTYLPAPEVPVEKLDGEIVDQDPALD